MTADLFRTDTPYPPESMPRFLAVDFFCGAGGTTRGMIDAGGYVIAGVDKAENCARTYVDNNRNTTLDGKNVEFLNRDIFPVSQNYPHGQKELLTRELAARLADTKARAPGVPVMFAICAPCQPFTGLSRKKLGQARQEGRERDRKLLLEAGKLVETFLPEIVVSENVAGIRKTTTENIWQEFTDFLEKLGYVVGSELVSTENFGIAQMRRRSILVAVRRKFLVDRDLTSIPIPTSDPKAEPVTVREVIGTFPPLGDGDARPDFHPNHRTAKLSDLNRRRIAHARPGESNDYLLEVEGGALALDCHKDAMGRTGGVHKTFTDVYTRMHPDRPAPTITTNCHSISNGRFGHYDVSQNRAISLREAAALQSFDENYVFHPHDRTGNAARLIGNAVPPRLARFFADYAVGLVRTGRTA